MVDRKEKLARWLAKRDEEKEKEVQKQKNKAKSVSHNTTIKTTVGSNKLASQGTFSYSQKRSTFAKPLDPKTPTATSTFRVPQQHSLEFASNLFTPGNGRAPHGSHVTALNTGMNGQMSTKKLREKLQAHSTRKKIKAESAMKEAKPNPYSTQTASIKTEQHTIEQIRFNNLKKAVISQVAATKLVIKECRYKEAKADLSMLVEEIPSAADVGEFWVVLAEIEKHLKGRDGALGIYALAFEKLRLSDKPQEAFIVQSVCAEYLRQSFKLERFISLDTVFKACSPAKVMPSELLEEDESEQKDEILDYTEDDDEEELTLPQPQVDDEDVEEEIEQGLQQYLYHQPTPKPEKTVIKGPSRVLVSGGAHIKKEKHRHQIGDRENAQDLSNYGSVVVLAAVNAKGKVRSDLGTDMVLTPVRRATRLHSGQFKSDKMDITKTGYAYTPNRALAFDDGNDTPRPYLSAKQIQRKKSITPERVRQELERLLIG